MACAGLLLAVFAQAAAGDDAAVLSNGSPWRAFVRLAPPMVGRGESAQPEKIKGHVAPTQPPPRDWTEPGFDDRSWLPVRVPFWGGYGYARARNAANLYLRGRFVVPDPDAVQDVRVGLTYRGGAVVYVNGVEVGRGHLPDGEITAETLADDYPLGTYTVKPPEELGLSTEEDSSRPPRRGLLLPPSDYPAEHRAARYNLRLRKLSVGVPTEALRKGVNVVGVELHRSAMLDFRAHGLKNPGARGTWNHLGLLDARATARAGAAALVAEPEPGEMLVLPARPALPVERGMTWAMPRQARIRLVAPRGGAASGQVVLPARGALKDTTIEPGELREVRGRDTIPREELQVRFAWWRSPSDAQYTRRFADVLFHRPDPEADLQPVWLTVNVPADAAAGRYQGALKVSADGAEPVNVPIELRVSHWTLPRPSQRGFVLEIFQSPETLAWKYKTPLWSDQHFALIERSMRLLGPLGGCVAVVPLSGKTYLGNSHTMVRWVDRDGTWAPEFSVARRYLDLFAKYHGPPRLICLDVWHQDMGTIKGSIGSVNDPGRATEGPLDHVPVSAWDPDTGELSILKAPAYDDENAEAFWRPALEGMRKLAAARGLPGETLALGYAGDRRPLESQAAFFRRMLPKSGWMLRTHTPTPGVVGAPAVFASTPFAPRGTSYPEVVFPRDYRPGYNSRPALGNDTPPAVFRNVPPRALLEGWSGVGGIGADLWPMPSEYGPHPIAPHVGHLGPDYTLTELLAPGPDGPLATVRYEAFREGLQVAEAQWFLVRALTDKTKRARLSEHLVARCQKLMRERREAIRASAHVGSWYPWPGWQQRTAQLFELAAEVAASLKGHAR